MPNINNYQIRKIYAIGGALGMRGADRQDALHDLVNTLSNALFLFHFISKKFSVFLQSNNDISN